MSKEYKEHMRENIECDMICTNEEKKNKSENSCNNKRSVIELKEYHFNFIL